MVSEYFSSNSHSFLNWFFIYITVGNAKDQDFFSGCVIAGDKSMYVDILELNAHHNAVSKICIFQMDWHDEKKTMSMINVCTVKFVLSRWTDMEKRPH
ncbi:hypothetical protein VNO77_04918 [Canavalia gladiata]|uniref:Uncharacterized protein n=1 Tax=Canavalia gladiata TaxID=3824 RepID=A0AAN9R864_CANGL